jgi:hypothetical protein
MSDQPRAVLTSEGFRGHACLFCHVPIPSEDRGELTVTVTGSGKPNHFWAHRRCLRDALHPQVRATIEWAGGSNLASIFPLSP